jgi:hypothetical protein
MRYLSDSVGLLKQGLRIWLFRKPLFDALRPSFGSLILLASLIAGLAFINDLQTVRDANQDGPRAIYWSAIGGILLVLAPLGIAAWVVSRRLQNLIPDAMGQLLGRLLAAFLLYRLFHVGLSELAQFGLLSPKYAFYSWLAVGLWFVIACGFFLTASSELAEWIAQDWRARVIPWLFPLLLWPSVHWTRDNPVGPFWFDAKRYVPQPTLASERALNEQARLIGEKLTALQAHRPGLVDAYFIAFAPDATEDVFKREVDTIAPLMDDRFGTKGRSLRMLNHSTTLMSDLIATQTYLDLSLAHIAKLMDRQEDILILYMTSHGSAQHELVPRFPPMQLELITPQSLKRILDKHGFKNRVIVVSACYSGGFIEPLKGPDTLIMTAAAKDKTSFGCGNDSDFTYFGKAVFDEQLRKTRSFEQAFKDALPVIAEREKKIGATPSDPQIAVGASIKAKLLAWEKQF